jgi:hypothetical protein
VQEWCDAGVIMKLPRGDYPKICIPIFTVPKKEADGSIKDEPRVVADASPLNSSLIDDKYPIPTVMDFINYIGPFDFITLIDLKAAYQRFRCAEHCIHFRWRGDYYVFLKAFFGVKTMSAKFQSVVDASKTKSSSDIPLLVSDTSSIP